MRKNTTVLVMIIAFALVFTSCKNKKADYVDDGTVNIDFINSSGLDADHGDYSSLLGGYTYPDHPAEELRSYLADDVEERGLPMDIND